VGVPDVGPVGRGTELARVDSFLEAAQAGLRVLAIAGPAGIGKTTLWREGVERAAREGRTVLAARPSGAEATLSYAALADLLDGLPDDVYEELPTVQRRALDVALLREDTGAESLDGHVVAAGLLSVLRVLSEEPVLLAVDDAQWLDHATAAALEYAIRRLEDRPVGVLVAVRTEDDRPATFERAVSADRLEELDLDGLAVASLHGVLKAGLGHSFPRPVLVRIAAASGGNPFHALEVGRELQRTDAATDAPLPVPRGARTLARTRVEGLPDATLEALLVAAVLARPTTALVDVEALEPAERAGIVEVAGNEIRFTHPLLASAVYESAPAALRRRAHRLVADRIQTPEEQARHLALAADGPDEETAAALDRAADSVSARGAAVAAAELKTLAVRMTPPADRDAALRRRQELASCLYFAGDATGARRELEELQDELPAGELRAEVLLELGSVVWAQGEGDRGLALIRDALTETESRSLQARIHSRISLLAEDCDLGLEHGEAAVALLDVDDDPLAYSFALHNRARWKLYAGGGADHGALERGMQLQREAKAWEVSAVPAYWARDFDDFETARARFEDLFRVLRERGDDAHGCAVLAHLAVIEAMTGESERARHLAAEAQELAEQTEQQTWVNVALWASSRVDGLCGDPARARAAAEEVLRRLELHPDSTVERMARDALGVAAFAESDFDEADRQLSRADAIDETLHVREPAAERFHADYAESVICLGDLDRAEQLVGRLEERAERIPRPWISTVAARSRGLLLSASGDLDGALAAFELALASQADLAMPIERGRTQLAVGQLLRRRKERRLARAAFEHAAAEFDRAGSAVWRARAEAELARVPVRRAPAELTATEETIASLAARGLTNKRIAERIFVSPKTVEANLARAYRKLGIHSRAELGRAMAEREQAVET
jgi:DNA-binding NarL/FixJ family response regulator